MKIAVIETGGKQYLVKAQDKLRVPSLAAEAGTTITFDRVLLLAQDESAQVGTPYVAGAKAEAKVLAHGRADKVLVMKYHSKTRYRRKKGHRQKFTEIQVMKID
ncbi:MAG: 50S ribosomal protein L21 [Candidatus Doudnabacteria bacterium]|nr:50S ribosomal protein L21 [Candidatus Doudnabacteria bacterium]